MHRHRHQHIGRRQHSGTRPKHQPRDASRGLRTVGMFEGQNQALCCFVVTQGRARLSKGRRESLLAALAYPLPCRGAKRQRHAALRAKRCRHKMRVAEAGQAELPVILHRRVAGETVGRQQRIQYPGYEGYHLEQIFDLHAVRMHRDRAARRISRVAPVLDELAARLLDRLDDTNRKFRSALDFGGRGSVAPALIARGMDVISADFSGPMAALAGGRPIVIESENFGLGSEEFDLVVAHLSLHWINDLPGALIQFRQVLKPEGLLLASIPVLDTLGGLRAALLEAEEALTGGVSPRVSPFPDLRDCAGLLQRAGFALPVADVEDIELSYANPLRLLHELRDAGETNAVLARSGKFAPKELFPAALGAMPMRNGRHTVMLRMAVMTGWAS